MIFFRINDTKFKPENKLAKNYCIKDRKTYKPQWGLRLGSRDDKLYKRLKKKGAALM